MGNQDLFNLTLLDSSETVDHINKKFYGRYNYPWPPSIFPAYPEGVARAFVNQDVGCWGLDRIPEKPKIWVAGCGTNQALFVALKFPEAEVLATDISTMSLRACQKKADQIGVSNLRIEEKSLNSVEYDEEFDYIICTGVVHHNAKPELTLQRISKALKKNGIFEFMVYNYYHRLLTTACQKSVRNFYDPGTGIDIELELSIISSLVGDVQPNTLMGDFIRSYNGLPEAEMADNLVQPVEYSYTIESLNTLVSGCNLEFLTHCQNQFDVDNNAFTWNMRFQNEFLKERYYSLPDIRRWQISNLLMFNNSPMLWFYFQRKDSVLERKPEQQICEEFLNTTFQKNSFLMTNYLLNAEGNYRLSDRKIKTPSEDSISDPEVKRIYNSVRPDRKMKDVLSQCRIKDDFYDINKVRIKLTTSGYPYLLAVR